MSLSPSQARALLNVAHKSIQSGLAEKGPFKPNLDDFDPALREIRTSFVTLNIGGRLRGCIGGLVAAMPLVSDTAQHAYAAANSDPRFTPLTAAEYPNIEMHISILTPSTPIEFSGDKDLLTKLQPGKDGLIIELGARRGTFLPSVWEQLPDPAEFLGHLKVKAGIAAGEQAYRAFRYMTESIR